MKRNPAAQRNLHMVAETVALVAIAPVLWKISEAPTLTPTHRQFLKGVALGTVVVDGYLLLKWLEE